MLDYARERAREALRTAHTAVLATSGPAGVQASEFPCEAIDLNLYLLVPRTSDHLFNLERDARVALLSDEWELKGEAHALSPGDKHPELSLIPSAGAQWYVLIEVKPIQIQIRRKGGWGNAETIDVEPNSSEPAKT
jgi:Pyridoxamine 5'-phosphate oxidase